MLEIFKTSIPLKLLIKLYKIRSPVYYLKVLTQPFDHLKFPTNDYAGCIPFVVGGGNDQSYPNAAALLQQSKDAK
jgi:hypothetical protein